MKPSVGQTVHYVSYGTPGGEYTSECRAAVITEVDDHEVVGLAVLNPTGMFFNRAAEHDPGNRFNVSDSRPALCRGLAYRGGTWHWPEQVCSGTPSSSPGDGVEYLPDHPCTNCGSKTWRRRTRRCEFCGEKP